MATWEPNYLNDYSAHFLSATHLGLRMNHFISFQEKHNGTWKLANDWPSGVTVITVNEELCGHAVEEQRGVAAYLRSRGYGVDCFEASAGFHFLPGLGTAHVAENGLSLDQTFGVPILGGSGVKGVTRAWAVAAVLGAGFKGHLGCVDRLIDVEGLEEMLGAPDTKNLKERTAVGRSPEPQQLLDEDFLARLCEPGDLLNSLAAARRIFGRPDRAGEVLFLDAIPAKATLKADVMTPHTGSYYRGSGWPTDSEEPNPIKFLAVEEGSVFSFVVAGRDAALVSQASKWLKEALANLGAGAKTAVGYGWFTSFENRSGRVEKAASGIADARLSEVDRLMNAICTGSDRDSWQTITQCLNEETRERLGPKDLRRIDEALFERLMGLPASVVAASPENVELVVKRAVPLIDGETERQKLARHILAMPVFAPKRGKSALGPRWQAAADALRNLLPEEEDAGADPDTGVTEELAGVRATLEAGKGNLKHALERAGVLLGRNDIPNEPKKTLAQAVNGIAVSAKTLGMKQKQFDKVKRTAGEYL